MTEFDTQVGETSQSHLSWRVPEGRGRAHGERESEGEDGEIVILYEGEEGGEVGRQKAYTYVRAPCHPFFFSFSNPLRTFAHFSIDS